MSYEDVSPLSKIFTENLNYCDKQTLIDEIALFRKALQYCLSQEGDDNCWMDYRHMLMRFLPGYDPLRDDVTLDKNQLKNCESFVKCWQSRIDWKCLGGNSGKTVPARSIGTLDCLKESDV